MPPQKRCDELQGDRGACPGDGEETVARAMRKRIRDDQRDIRARHDHQHEASGNKADV
jgi:hypothetical protein